MAEAEISNEAMEEADPSNHAIARFLNFCRDEVPSERDIQYYLQNNSFEEDI